MINFIAGILVGFLIFGVTVILIDKFLCKDFDTSPIDILGGVLFGIWYGVSRLFKNIGENARRSGYISDATELYPDDFIEDDFEEEEFIDEDVGDEVMVYIDSMVDFCKEDSE